MALTKFVRNVEDLSDDGGYKFRFRCDGCSDGYESQYIGSSANLLKTAVDVFSMFRVFGSGSRRVAEGLDRGLRGKERDAAYEQAMSEAMAHFKKCAACGRYVCPEHCWNDGASMCEGCAPDATEAAAKHAAQRRVEQAVQKANTEDAAIAPVVTCPACGAQARGAKFCEGCGAAFGAPSCRHCQQPISAGARFCGSCGGAQA
jgi:hypothetical protein